MKKLVYLPLLAALTTACGYEKSTQVLAPSPVVDIAAPTTTPPTSSSYPSNGPDVIAYVAAKYPEKLAAGVSREERVENMKFLRDRVIEVGRCGGLDLGWNLKRGGPEISIDFIAERINGEIHGHDIALDYDNTSSPLRLHWAGGDFPFFGEYPSVECE